MRNGTRTVAALALAGSMVLGGIGAVAAADAPADVIKYRQQVMHSLGAHISAIAAIAKGEVTFVDHAEAHARAMASVADHLLVLFPEGSDTGAEHRALPSIWQDWSGFETAARKMADALPQLVEATASRDVAAIGGALREVGGSCKGCHDDFREEKD